MRGAIGGGSGGGGGGGGGCGCHISRGVQAAWGSVSPPQGLHTTHASFSESVISRPAHARHTERLRGIKGKGEGLTLYSDDEGALGPVPVGVHGHVMHRVRSCRQVAPGFLCSLVYISQGKNASQYSRG
ncbi:hypothetical protein E2C01_015997 [Portunus trituberculatus]|uniref:Uncharacterized protein n=1 Tax=Portunus trituberculatus TaxID=210409 RepID=A0A5B7DP23_PORTR|nr:hypothetical protein [Portunus trituberculatus]